MRTIQKKESSENIFDEYNIVYNASSSLSIGMPRVKFVGKNRDDALDSLYDHNYLKSYI
jgi:hypothetical protein